MSQVIGWCILKSFLMIAITVKALKVPIKSTNKVNIESPNNNSSVRGKFSHLNIVGNVKSRYTDLVSTKRQLLETYEYNPSVRNCTPGYRPSRSGNKCVCMAADYGAVVSCLEDGRVYILKERWAYLDKNSGLLKTYECAPEKCGCKKEIKDYACELDLDNQCINGRNGTLCGECMKGFSVVLGSDKCKICTNNYLGWIVFGTAVFFIFALIPLMMRVNIVGFRGYLHSFVFSINANNVLVTEKSHIDPYLSNINVNWCLTDGLTDIEKIALNFSFPIFFLLLPLVLCILPKCFWKAIILYEEFFKKIGRCILRILKSIKNKYCKGAEVEQDESSRKNNKDKYEEIPDGARATEIQKKKFCCFHFEILYKKKIPEYKHESIANFFATSVPYCFTSLARLSFQTLRSANINGKEVVYSAPMTSVTSNFYKVMEVVAYFLLATDIAMFMLFIIFHFAFGKNGRLNKESNASRSDNGTRAEQNESVQHDCESTAKKNSRKCFETVQQCFLLTPLKQSFRENYKLFILFYFICQVMILSIDAKVPEVVEKMFAYAIILLFILVIVTYFQPFNDDFDNFTETMILSSMLASLIMFMILKIPVALHEKFWNRLNVALVVVNQLPTVFTGIRFAYGVIRSLTNWEITKCCKCNSAEPSTAKSSQNTTNVEMTPRAAADNNGYTNEA